MTKRVPGPLLKTRDARERRFVQALASGMSVAKAGEEIGVSKPTAYRMANSERVLSRYALALQQAGIDDDTLAQVLAAALKANKHVQVSTPQPGIYETIEVPDHRTRLEAVKQVTDTALKLQALGKAEDEQAPVELPAGLDEMDTVELTAFLTKSIKRS